MKPNLMKEAFEAGFAAALKAYDDPTGYVKIEDAFRDWTNHIYPTVVSVEDEIVGTVAVSRLHTDNGNVVTLRMNDPKLQSKLASICAINGLDKLEDTNDLVGKKLPVRFIGGSRATGG